MNVPAEVDAGRVESAEPLHPWRRPLSSVKNWVDAADELSGVVEDDMMAKSGQRKLGTTRGQPVRARQAKASRISRCAVKPRCAREWGGWGRISVDGPGHYNPVRSEGPWGRATWVARTAVLHPSAVPTQSGVTVAGLESTKGADKPDDGKGMPKGMPGAGLTDTPPGKVPPDMLALEPYWGKPAVRNLRGAGGNGARFALHGHEAGNGGYSQAQTYGHRASGPPDRTTLVSRSTNGTTS
jgi:hypothetical protein